MKKCLPLRFVAYSNTNKAISNTQVTIQLSNAYEFLMIFFVCLMAFSDRLGDAYEIFCLCLGDSTRKLQNEFYLKVNWCTKCNCLYIHYNNKVTSIHIFFVFFHLSDNVLSVCGMFTLPFLFVFTNEFLETYTIVRHTHFSVCEGVQLLFKVFIKKCVLNVFFFSF